MLLTVIGDPHAQNKNLDKIGQLFDLIEELGNNTLLLGDLFDTKEVIRGKAFNYVRDRLKNSKLKFIILVGNHDWFNLECLDHSLQALKDLPNVTIVDSPVRLGINVGAIPYIHDKAKFKEAISVFNQNDTVFVHQGFSKFDYGNGHIAEGESELEDISHVGTVISGHFHKYQQSGNLTYLGTPFSHSFGETDQNKYIGVFDTETKELQLYESPFPRHITLTFNAGAPLELQNIARDFSNDYIRCIVEGSQEELLKYNRAHLESLSSSVKIIEKPTDEFQSDITIDETTDNIAQFQQWGREIKKLDPETLKLGLQILGGLNAK